MSPLSIFTALAIAAPVVAAPAIAAPVTAPVSVKTDASWQPVALTRLNYGVAGHVRVRASESLIWAEDEKYYLKTGQLTTAVYGTQAIYSNGYRPVGVGTYFWHWKPRTNARDAQLILDDGGQPARTYAMPNLYQKLGNGLDGTQVVRLRPSADRLELLLGNNYYRWSAQSRKLERYTALPGASVFIRALASDGESVICLNEDSISEFSTRTGRRTRLTPLRGFKGNVGSSLSPSGRTALCEILDPNRVEQVNIFRVVDAATGRARWTLRMPYNNADPVFSPDESEIAIPINPRHVWEIRDTQTGALLRTLPSAPDALGPLGALGAAYSPDGATLYSVAGGVLYRQRAR